MRVLVSFSGSEGKCWGLNFETTSSSHDERTTLSSHCERVMSNGLKLSEGGQEMRLSIVRLICSPLLSLLATV